MIQLNSITVKIKENNSENKNEINKRQFKETRKVF